MNIRSHLLTYFVIAIAVAIAVGLYWYFYKNRAADTDVKVETTEEAVEILSQTPPVTVETNPVKKVPDLNPVEKINPFKARNPFE